MEKKLSAVSSLRLIYFSLLVGMLVFSCVVFFAAPSPTLIIEEDTCRIILIICLVLATIALTASGIMMRKGLEKIRGLNTVAEKFDRYRILSIRTYALTEAPAIFGMVGYFLTTEIKFLAVIGLMIVRFLTLYPSTNKIATDIEEGAGDIDILPS